MKRIVFRLCMASIFLATETAGMSVLDHHSEANVTCTSDKFTCNNGNCTSMKWTCNGRDDCGDFSDEIDCQNRRPKCNSSEILCGDGLQCISETKKCDRIEDCFDALDELNCSRLLISTEHPLGLCPMGEFRCDDSSRCIPKSKHCDGYKDCRNGEDEKSCAKKTCQPDEFTCKNGACTKMNWKCDHNDDCGDNSDETDCPPPSSEDTTLLVFGSQDGLYEIDLRNKSRMTHISKKIVLSFDFPSESSQIYWSDGKRIYQLSRHNGNNEAVKFRPDDVKSVASLAVDGPAKKLYWTDTLQGAIYVGDLKNDRTVKLMEENLESPRAIVLSKGYLYFADSGRKPKIERARLDGSKRKTLFIFDSNLVPNGLALDETRNKLYCAGTDLAGYGVIGVITLSDLNITFIFQRTAGYRPFGLDIFEEHVYWTDQGKNALLRINKSSGTGMEVIISGLNKPNGLKILQRVQERLGGYSTQDSDNPFPSTVAGMVAGGTCVYKNGGCEHLCLNLLHPAERKCLCEEGFRLGEDGKTCEMGRMSVPGEEMEEKKDETWIAATWLLIALSLLLVLFLGGAAVKKFLSWSRERGLPDVIRMVLREEVNSPEMEPIMHADPQVENTTDASPEWNQQGCSAESTGACAVSEDLPLQVQVQGDVVVYNTVNMMNTVHMNNTNNVELQQSGGVTVVGDEAKVNYHQASTS